MGDVIDGGVEGAAPPVRSSEHWIVLGFALLGPVLLAVLAFFVSPDPRGHGTHEKLGLPPCAMMEWLRVPCPGCGVTTSVALAAHGRISDAARTQPFGLVVTLGIIVAAAWALAGHFRGRDLHRDLNAIRLAPWLWTLGGALALSWLYKIAVVLFQGTMKFGASP